MQDIVIPLAQFLEWTFQILPILGNIPNMIFLAGGFIGLFVWLKMQKDYNNKPEKDGYIR